MNKSKLGPNDLCPVCGKKTKHCPGHPKTTGKKVVIGILIITILLAGIILAYAVKSLQPEEIYGDANYKVILSQVTDKEISEFYTPVFIFRDGQPWGSGTLWQAPRGWRIVTAAHLFPGTEPSAYYEYQKLRPRDDTRYPINSLEQFPGSDKGYFNGYDVVLCIPGEKKSISGLPGYALGGQIVRMVSGSAIPPFGPLLNAQYTSLIDGKSRKCIGCMLGKSPADSSPPPVTAILLPKKIIGGESGSGFITDHGNLLVLTGGGSVTPEVRKGLSLSNDVDEISIGVMLSQSNPSFNKAAENDDSFRQKILVK